MAVGDLTTKADVKTFFNIVNTTDDALLDRLVSAVSAYITQWLSHSLLTTGYTEKYDGHGGKVLTLLNYPVTAVTSVTVNGQSIPASPNGVAPGFVFSRFAIYLIGSWPVMTQNNMQQAYDFARGFQNISVTYTAGFATTPLDVAQACIEMIGVKYKERTRVGEVSKSIAGEVVAFSQKDMSDNVKTILLQYKRIVPI
jgi:hypothetical protein